MNKLYHTVAVTAKNESKTNAIALVSGLYYVICIAVETASVLKQDPNTQKIRKDT